MSELLITTKIMVPQAPSGVVVRQRLYDLLDEGTKHQLLLVSAPAEYGKTTLISAWLAQSGLQAVWLSLDSADNDLARFLIYLAAALEQVAPALILTPLCQTHFRQVFG